MSLSLLTSCVSALSVSGERVLGGAWIGAGVPHTPAAWPQQSLATQVLDPGHLVQDLWVLDAGVPLHAGMTEGIAWRRGGDLLFGVAEVCEAGVRPKPPRTALEQASFDIYARIFRLLDAQGLPHLWRLWNYMADINGEAGGMERYRQFNMGRGDAFEAGARSVVGRVPAACALGVASGPLTVAFLAGPTPIVPVENPRQVSAFHYPSLYGPRSPTFSRAALVHPPGQEILFVSGTASIVGHQTVHQGDVRAQTAECLDNIGAVLAEASGMARSGRFAPGDLGYRAYVRHPADLAAVRQVMVQRLGDAPVVYVQADVCRADLMVEIEGQAVRSV